LYSRDFEMFGYSKTL